MPTRPIGTKVLTAAAAIGAALMPASASAGMTARGVPAAAVPTQVTVIPQDPPRSIPPDNLYFAGSTGFLHHVGFSAAVLWTRYSDGQTTVVPGLATTNLTLVTPAGSDTVWLPYPPAAQVVAGNVAELDLADLTWQHYPLPVGGTALAVCGSSLIVRVVSGNTVTFEVVNDGSHITTPITGLPAGAILGRGRCGGTYAVLSYQISGTSGSRYGVIDLSSAAFTSIPGTNEGGLVALTATSILLYGSFTHQVLVFSTAGVISGLNTTPQSVTLPPLGGSASNYAVALAGDHVIAVPEIQTCIVSWCTQPVAPALDVPLSGAATGTAVAQAQASFNGVLQAADGSALVIGGTGTQDWSDRLLNVDGGDNLTDTAVFPLTGPITDGGLTISQGLVRHIEIQPVPGDQPIYSYFNHPLVGNSSGFGGVEGPGGTFASPLPCASGATCVRTVDGNWYGTSFLTAGSTPGTIKLWQENGSLNFATLPSADGSIVDASADFVIVDGVSPSAQYVVDPGHETIVLHRPVTGAALWFDSLWSADGPGHLQATDLDANGAVIRTIPTGATCAATQVQATTRWIYWSCGAAGPAGVYDLQGRVDISVPAGLMQLGDGYLVHQDNGTGDLSMYDFHTGAVTGPLTLATNVVPGPAADNSNITWAVDRYSGDVAYVTPDDAVSVIDTGVPATPTAIGSPRFWIPGGLGFGTVSGWGGQALLTRPVSSWTVTIKRLSTGQVVHVQSGGPARVGVFMSWDGFLRPGVKAFSGRYSWSLAAAPAGVTSFAPVASAELTVFCGQLPFRSYDCAGMPAMLAVKSSGEGHWFNGTVSGGLSDNGYTDTWNLGSAWWQVSAIVPFGDFNGDGFGDLLVRRGNGVLRAYLGFGQSYFGANKSIRIGSGWNAYDILAAPGDLTGDGRADLVARDHSGRLWLIAGSGHGWFHRPALIGSGWGGYARLVGAGDLTGGGAGDLLAITPGGVMWRYDGNGHGGFARPVMVSAGWGAYNAVIGIGDLDNDGRNDLLARDRSGKLWFFAGDGHGGFAARKLVSTGWQFYEALF